MSIHTILNGDFTAASALITFGAVLGKCSLFQLFGIASIHAILYGLNRAIILEIFKANDAGGSMIIHVFGASFGLAASLFYQKKAAIEDKDKMDNGNYLSDVISMIGTLFLFCYWPSFNAVESAVFFKQRAIINTYLSLATGVVAALIWSRFIYGKIEMEIILNASIAGGVAMGCNADIIKAPFGAMITGFICATASSFCYGYVQPWVRKKNLFHDTCGVTYLHGIPGIIGGLTSAIMAARARDNFGDNYG
jgi:ammonium transporter Rh